MTYSQRSSSNAQTQKSEREYASPGQHFNPWRRVRLVDGRKVWIVRQDGDGQKAWYFTDANERIDPANVVERL